MESETKGQPRTPTVHTAPPTPNGRTAPRTSNDHTPPPTPDDHTAPRTPNGHTAPHTPNDRTAPPTPNDRTAPPTPNDHTAPRTPNGRTAPRTPDDRTAPRMPDERTAPRTPNDHTASPAPNDRTALRTPNDHTAPPAPNDRTAPLAPNDHTAPPTPNDRTAPRTPGGHTAARRAFACPAATIASALLTVPALNELFPTVLLPVLPPFLPTQIEAVAGLAGTFRENLPVPADSRGRLFAGLFPSVAAVGSWPVFGGAYRRGGGMQSVGLIPVRVGVAIAGLGVFGRVAATAVLFRLTGGMTRVVRNGECPARTPFRLSAAVLFPGGALTFALVVADVLSLFGVAGKIPFVLPFSFGVSGVVISPFDGYLAGPAPAAEPFAFAAFLLKFRGRVNSETEHSA